MKEPNFAVYNGDGRILRVGYSHPDNHDDQAGAGESVMELTATYPNGWDTYQISGGAVIDRPTVTVTSDSDSLTVEVLSGSVITFKNDAIDHSENDGGTYSWDDVDPVTVTIDPPWPHQPWEGEVTLTGYDPTETVVPRSADTMRKRVNEERDRRLAAGFSYNGNNFDFDSESKANISGAGAKAGLAILSGTLPTDLRWHGGPADFFWIDSDNNQVVMSALDVSLMSDAAIAHVSGHIWAASVIKALDPIPLDYDDDSYWP